MTVKALRARGYTVLEARDGREALDVAGAWNAPLDLLVTDVEMPNLGGRELAQALSAQRPGLRVVFISGRQVVGLPPSALFLLKPFTPAQLAGTVRRALE